jgi:hypothetical protein
MPIARTNVNMPDPMRIRRRPDAVDSSVAVIDRAP